MLIRRVTRHVASTFVRAIQRARNKQGGGRGAHAATVDVGDRTREVDASNSAQYVMRGSASSAPGIVANIFLRGKEVSQLRANAARALPPAT
jgi:hypothetical protein